VDGGFIQNSKLLIQNFAARERGQALIIDI